MACMMFDEERSRKQRRPTSNLTLRYFASSTVVRVQIIRVWEVRTLVGMSGLVIVLDKTRLPLPMKKTMNVEEKN